MRGTNLNLGRGAYIRFVSPWAYSGTNLRAGSAYKGKVIKGGIIGHIRRAHNLSSEVNEENPSWYSRLYTEQRLKVLEEAGIEKYPYYERKPDSEAAFQTIHDFRKMYEPRVSDGLEGITDLTQIHGRIKALRSLGKVTFLEIESEGGRIQAKALKKHVDGKTWGLVEKVLKLHDFVSVSGTPVCNKKKELLMQIENVTLLAPCLHDVPASFEKNSLRYRYRSLDMLVNRRVKTTLINEVKSPEGYA